MSDTSSSSSPPLDNRIVEENKNRTSNRHVEFIQSLLKENLTNFLAQAIIKIIYTPFAILNIFLFISVLFMSAMASYLFIQSTMTYFQYEVSTKSRTFYLAPTLFPKVTFCNVVPFTTQYGYDLRRQSREDHKIHKMLSAFNGISLLSRVGNLSDIEKKKLSHNLEDILIECWFNGIQCNANDFVWSHDETYGNCYTFNSGFDSTKRKVNLRQSTISDPNFGLQLILYVNIYEKLLEFANVLGAVIRIGNSSYSTYYSNSGIFVATGQQSYISLEREFKTILPKPYSNCEVEENASLFRANSDLYNLIGQSDYGYTQQLCFVQCLQKHLIAKYNCSLHYFTSLYLNSRVCNLDEFNLIYKSDQIFSGTFLNEFCLPLCPLECNQTLYKASLSFNHLNGQLDFISKIKNNPKLAADFIERPINAVTARESIVYAKIYYDSLSYTLTSESPQMDFVSLLASIGGNLGLFLGVSIFSIIEVVVVCFEIFYYSKK